MTDKNSILFVNDYGIYPELLKALTACGYAVKTEQLMRKAIKAVKNDPPDLLIAEFYHEPQFRDRVSNLESILSQIQKNSKKSRTLILYYPEHVAWLEPLGRLFQLDVVMSNQAPVEEILEKAGGLLGV